MEARFLLMLSVAMFAGLMLWNRFSIYQLRVRVSALENREANADE